MVSILEYFVLRRWNHTYFKSGLCIFSVDIPVGIDSLERVDFDLLANSLRGRAVDSVDFHQFTDMEYGFRGREKKSLFQSKHSDSSSMHGFIRADAYAGQVTIMGNLSWSFVAMFLVFFSVFASANQTDYPATQRIFSVVAALMMLVSFFFSRYRLGKLCKEIAWFVEKSIAER